MHGAAAVPRGGVRSLALPARLACASLLAFFPFATIAHAGEDDIANTPVRSRHQSAYDPIGVRADAFIFYPSVTVGMQYDSNVFAAVEPIGDWALITAPELRVISDRGDGTYELDLGAEHYAYDQFDNQDRTDAHARFRLSRQLTTDIQWDAAFEAARRHELKGESFVLTTAAEPIGRRDLRAETSITKTFNRLGVLVGGKIRDVAYDDVDTISGGTLDQSFRDGTIITTTLKPFYDFSPGYRAYARIELSRRDYAGEGSLDRDSEGYDARAGLEFRITPLILGSTELGYLSQDYSNPSIPTVEGLSAGARVMWLMTPLMTMSFFADRSVAEAAAPDQEGRLDFTAGAQLDYEIMRNLILSLEGTYKNEEFSGTSRVDDVVKFSAKLDYFLSRRFNFGLTYNYIDRSSDIPIYDFDKHVVTLNVTAQH